MAVLVAGKRFNGWQSVQSRAGTDPAANTEISYTIPAGELWLLVGVTIVCAQGATQTPQPILKITDGTNLIFQAYGATAAMTASTTCTFNWGVGLPQGALIGATTNVNSTAPLAGDLLLGPSYVISTLTIGIGANTDYGAPIFRFVKGSA